MLLGPRRRSRAVIPLLDDGAATLTINSSARHGGPAVPVIHRKKSEPIEPSPEVQAARELQCAHQNIDLRGPPIA